MIIIVLPLFVTIWWAVSIIQAWRKIRFAWRLHVLITVVALFEIMLWWGVVVRDRGREIRLAWRLHILLLWWVFLFGRRVFVILRRMILFVRG